MAGRKEEMKTLRGLGLLLAAALVLALLVPVPNYENFVADVETRRLQESGHCPLSTKTLRATSPEVVVLCSNYGLTAYADALRHKASALRVYGLLGATAELHEARRLYGPKVIAVIDRYYTEGSTATQAANATGKIILDLWEQLWDDPLAFSMPEMPEELSPEELAVYGLFAILENGEIFLAQFEWIENGTVARKPVESTLQTAYITLLGGVRRLEQKAVAGRELTAYDYGGAALDLAVVYAGWKILAKPIAGKAIVAGKEAKATKLAKLAAATTKATKAVTVGAKIGAVGAVGVLAYVAVTDPLGLATGVASAGAWIAEFAGLPGWLGATAGWFLLFCTIWALSWPIRLLLRPIGKLIPWRIALLPVKKVTSAS